MPKPSKIIAVEEHILTTGFTLKMREWAEYERKMQSMDLRLEEMDRHGIDMHLLSLSSPGVHRFEDAKEAASRIAASNDEIAETVAKHPDRLDWFCSLAMHDPVTAGEELERCVRAGAVGPMLNHHTNGEFLDAERLLPFWEKAAELDVPVYIHPAPAIEEPAVTRGYPGLGGPMWGWSHEIGGHALRLVLSGLFDRFPDQQIVLGHMAELLPYCLWRIDSRYLTWPGEKTLKKNPSDYIRSNILATTSGSFDTVPLKGCVEALGSDRVLFAIDYPYEEPEEAVAMLNDVDLPKDAVEAIAHGNAERVFGLTSS